MALDDRQVRVAEHDGVAAGESRRQPLLPTRRRARDVDEADPDVLDVDDELLGQPVAQRRLVRVPVDRADGRPERLQRLEERERREVAAVEDQVGGAARLQNDLGEPSGSPR